MKGSSGDTRSDARLRFFRVFFGAVFGVVFEVVGGVADGVTSAFLDTSFEPLLQPGLGAVEHGRRQPRPATAVGATAISAFTEMHIDAESILALGLVAMLGGEGDGLGGGEEGRRHFNARGAESGGDEGRSGRGGRGLRHKPPLLDVLLDGAVVGRNNNGLIADSGVGGN